ncbi:MAG: HD-GYP domain-containing protein [Vampirovibrionales bacterium]|nr:HD-GYP domain-containing protein [Vampirovibrionales bacterium]
MFEILSSVQERFMQGRSHGVTGGAANASGFRAKTDLAISLAQPAAITAAATPKRQPAGSDKTLSGSLHWISVRQKRGAFYVKRAVRRKSLMLTPNALAQESLLQTVHALTNALGAKDKYTSGHAQAVAAYAEKLSRALGLDSLTVLQVRLGALLHDIGKIGVPGAIINKPAALTEVERAVMNDHPAIGAKILTPLADISPLMPGVIEIVAHHHQLWDGSGYGPTPQERLSGQAIPLGARIVALVDAFHALTSKRSYRSAMSHAEAINQLKSEAGSKWDPALVAQWAALF